MSLFPLHKPSFPCFDIEGFQEIEVFENEVHGLFGWTCSDSKYTDETGLIVAPFKYLTHMQCPRGYSWVTDWLINRDYTTMDSDGWSYGTSFPRLSLKLRERRSDSTASPRQDCRRRLWFRIVQPSDMSSYNTIPGAIVTSTHICRVYENQEFSYFQGWKTYNFILANFADEKIASATEYKSLDAIACDKGFIWMTDWCKDKYYTVMGPGCWSYGTSPERIVDKYIQRCSSAKPTARQVYRRRLWYRLMRPLAPTDEPNGGVSKIISRGKRLDGKTGTASGF